MYTLIKHPGGVITEAIVLAAEGDRMRIAAAGFQDVMELNRYGGQWFTAEGQAVEFEFLMSNVPICKTDVGPGPAGAVRAGSAV